MATRRPSATLSVLLLICCAIWGASAANHNVGGSSGWKLSVDYTKWASGETFAVGDNLVFTYTAGAHTVAEVTENDYNACSASNAITEGNDGSTTIALKKSGKHYFICGIAGHCSVGMKLAIDVAESSSSTNTTSPATNSNKSSAAALSSPAYVVVALLGAMALKPGLFYF